MRKIILAICFMLLYSSANASMIYDYDYYEESGILQDVLDKDYIAEQRKYTRKVIKADRKLSKVLAKWENKGWDDNKAEKKVSRIERKIARTITKMDLVPTVENETVAVAVPEPSPLLLIGVGLVGLGISRKYLR